MSRVNEHMRQQIRLKTILQQFISTLSIVVLTGCLLFLFCVPAHAVMTPCGNIEYADGYKILLDKPSYTEDVFRTDSDFKVYMDRLRFKLGTKIESIELEEETAAMNVIQCDSSRQPQRSDFDEDIVEELNSDDVILEVWGSLNASRDDAGHITKRSALIEYTVVPVRFYEFFKSSDRQLPGIYSVEYPKSRNESISDSVDLLDTAMEFNAYAAIGLGIKSMKANNFELALKYLCKADVLLSDALSEQLNEPRSNKEKKLIKYVRDSAKKTVMYAKSDTSYTGALKLFPDGDSPCPVR